MDARGWTTFFLLVTGLSLFSFGVVNWNSLTEPEKKFLQFTEGTDKYRDSKVDYERQLAAVGKEAVIPKALAVPLTLVGALALGWGFGRFCQDLDY